MTSILKLPILLFVSMTVLLGCQTFPTKYSDYEEGQWEARALIKDKTQSKSYVVHLDIHARKNKQLRMDVTAALGTPVASLALNDEKVRYILFQQKQFFDGRVSERSLSPILSVPLDPRLLYHVLFDEPFADKVWSCSQDKKGFVEKCQNPKDSFVIQWKDRKGKKKSVVIQHPNAEIQINILSFKEGVSEVFDLKVPPTFQKLTAR